MDRIIQLIESWNSKEDDYARIANSNDERAKAYIKAEMERKQKRARKENHSARANSITSAIAGAASLGIGHAMGSAVHGIGGGAAGYTLASAPFVKMGVKGLAHAASEGSRASAIKTSRNRKKAILKQL